MPFTRPTLSTIITRVDADITSKLTGSASLLPSSLLAILAKVFSAAMHTFYGALVWVSKQIIVTTAETDWLDNHATMWGLVRIQATYASGDVIFTGDNGSFIPINTKVIRDDSVVFLTTVDASISGGTVTVNVEAEEAGESGNTDAGIFLTLLTPILGVDDTAEVDTGLDGGIDEETDTNLRERILNRIKTPPAGGADHDYINESRAVAGVDNAFVFGNQNELVEELGHVTVVIVGVSPKVPSGTLLTAVETALTDPDTGIVPVTATLHVSPIVEADIDIDIDIDPNTSEMQALITANLDDLFELEAEPGGTILLSHIRDAISSAGPDDYEITGIDVDGSPIGVVNITLTDFEYHILDTITYGTL